MRVLPFIENSLAVLFFLSQIGLAVPAPLKFKLHFTNTPPNGSPLYFHATVSGCSHVLNAGPDCPKPKPKPTATQTAEPTKSPTASAKSSSNEKGPNGWSFSNKISTKNGIHTNAKVSIPLPNKVEVGIGAVAGLALYRNRRNKQNAKAREQDYEERLRGASGQQTTPPVSGDDGSTNGQALSVQQPGTTPDPPLAAPPSGGANGELPSSSVPGAASDLGTVGTVDGLAADASRVGRKLSMLTDFE